MTYLKDSKLPPPGIFLVCTLLWCFVMPTGAIDEDLLITPYLGYRVGGDFTDISTGIELELAESDSYGLIVGKDSNTSAQLEFIYSLQPTNLKANGAVSSVVLVDVDVENFLVTGKKVLNKNSGTFVPV